MRWMLGLVFLVLIAPVSFTGEADPWAPHRKLKVLYAGKEGGSREKAFGAFLQKHFDTSAAIPLGKLSMDTAKDYDVVIVDWVSQYGNDGYAKRERSLFSSPIRLGPEFTKPFIAMTYVGTQVRGGYKLDWL
ncbi:MAG: hypothetical protein OER88_10910 [Planctomycetota bacterium]|nr:hypothetical protein [Planctomycetota bacterium]